MRTEAVAQPRQRTRATVIRGKPVAQNYTPKSHPVVAYKEAVQAALAEVYSGEPLEGPLRVQVLFLMRRPTAMVWKRKPMPRAPFGRKPDMDNLLKSLLDAMNKRAFSDDSQVCEVVALKCYAAGDEQPSVEVKISAIRYE